MRKGLFGGLTPVSPGVVDLRIDLKAKEEISDLMQALRSLRTSSDLFFFCFC